MPRLADPADVARAFSLTALPADFYDDPYPYYAALRSHAPVREWAPGQILLTAYDDVVAVYRDPRASSDKKEEFGPKYGDSPLYAHHTTSLFFNDPPLHTRVRKLILGAVNQRAIARMQPVVESLCDRLLGALSDRDTADLIDDFAARIPVEVIGNLLMVPHADRGPLRRWSLAILAALEPKPSQEMLDRGNAAVSEFLDYLGGLVAERRRQPGDPDVDVLTRLILGEQNGERLTETELFHNCIFLLNAGHETTTNLIGNGAYTLLAHPAEFDRLKADPGLMSLAVEEMLRYESPVQLNNRRLTAPMTLGGRERPAGTFVTLCIGAANRDPAQFADPDRFDIARRPNRHVAFGHGDHACAGMNVARMEGRVAFDRLVRRFPQMTLEGEPVRDRRARFRGFTRIPVRLR